jgi:DNA-3-methyladenine glycosylase I
MEEHARSDELPRCAWCLGSDIYRGYHDKEWGVPVHKDQRHFEFLILEGAQAGLSWLTILKRRDGYRRAFAGFDPEHVARFSEERQSDLARNREIIRNRRKIASAVNNARAFLDVQAEFGSFDRYIWGFVGGAPTVHHYRSLSEIPAETETSRALSKDLKSRGFSFVGPTIMYAHMQAIGMVNDHVLSCFRHRECAALS